MSHDSMQMDYVQYEKVTYVFILAYVFLVIYML